MRVTKREHAKELVARARAGEPRALSELYERYARSMYRTAYRLTSSRGDAEDVVQDVFVGLPEALRNYEHRGDLGPWIRRVVARTALMKLRWRRRKSEVPLDGVDPPAPVGSPTDRLTLEEALSSLPDPIRTVFVLREIEGYTHDEISGMLGIRAGASKVRLHRARRHLRRFLDDRK